MKQPKICKIAIAISDLRQAQEPLGNTREAWRVLEDRFEAEKQKRERQFLTAIIQDGTT